MEKMFENEIAGTVGTGTAGAGTAGTETVETEVVETEVVGTEVVESTVGQAKKAWVEAAEIAGAAPSDAEIAESADAADSAGRRGRPTTFRSEYIGMAMEYFSHVHRNEDLNAVVIPSRVFFARSIGQPLTTVKRWEKLFPEFGEVIADGIEHAKELRIMMAENKLLDGGFSKFVLASAYGMTEKSAVEVGGMEGKPFEVNISVVHK